MRDWRFCLLALVAVAAAGCGDDVETVEVVGTVTCTRVEFRSELDVSYRCEGETSDPRVSGTAEVAVIFEQRPPGTEMWGSFVLTNDGGTWRGDWTGEIDSESFHVVDGVLLGEGDYDGLQYDTRWEGVIYPWDVTGTIEPVP